jgi:hypothetical protein
MNDDPSGDYRFSAFIGPMVWTEARPDLPVEARGEPTLESLLRFLTHPDEKVDLKRYVGAYSRISNQEPMAQLFAVPFEPHILDKLVWPLRHAKANYVLGNYIDTIALCGMVGEMIAILRMELYLQRTLTGESLRTKLEKFERERQDDRVRIIRKAGAISEEEANHLHLIRTIRREHLHVFSERKPNPAEDALKVFTAASKVVAGSISSGFNQGKILLNPDLKEYLRKRGLIEPA